MRELKFRAWDKVAKRYWNVVGLSSFTKGKFDEVYVNCPVSWEGNEDCRQPEDVILEQYTGLKDKNGKEIYEGDIVEEFINCGARKCRTVWRVRWYEEECCFELHYLSGSLFGNSMMGMGVEYKVIGNIHENAELMKWHQKQKGVK